MVRRKLESKIRKRLDQLFDDIVAEGYDENDVEGILNDIEEELISELDEFEEEDED